MKWRVAIACLALAIQAGGCASKPVIGPKPGLPQEQPVVVRDEPQPDAGAGSRDEAELAAYSTIGTAQFSLAGAVTTALYVENPADHMVGVLVQKGKKLIPVRKPDKAAGGTLGPWYSSSFSVRDLDVDGTEEYLVQGPIGGHAAGIWVYHYNASTESFQLLGSLSGSEGVSLEEGPGGKTMVAVSRRDYEKADPKARITTRWKWKVDQFEEMKP